MLAKILSSIVVLAAAAALALWWGRDDPIVRDWWPRTWPALSSVAPAPAPAPAQAQAQAHKCVGPAGTIYTDGPCPAGSRPQALDGGSLSVLPRAPVAAAPAASAVPPLRRLSGPAVPDQQDRRVDQALQR